MPAVGPVLVLLPHPMHALQVQKDRPELSKWTLKWEAFGQDIELNWMAKSMQPTINQKIHWRSEDGLPNRCVESIARNLATVLVHRTCWPPWPGMARGCIAHSFIVCPCADCSCRGAVRFFKKGPTKCSVEVSKTRLRLCREASLSRVPVSPSGTEQSPNLGR